MRRHVPRRAPRGGRRLAARVVGVGLALAPLGVAGAQAAAAAAVAPTRSAAEAVMLRLRPRGGDTLRTRFEQSITVTPAAATGRAAAATMTSTLVVLARSAVEQVDGSGALITALTDSVTMSAVGVPARQLEQARRALVGRRARLRIAPDGAMELLGASGNGTASGPPGVGGGGARLPGTLPAMAVRIGAAWSRALPAPWSVSGAGAGGEPPTLAVTFRLDSTSHRGGRAWLTMAGGVRATPGAATRGGVTGGTVHGSLVVDLARGWVTDSRATFVLDARLPLPAEGRDSAAPAPSAVRVVVTQRLHAY
ncbi:MAG TPA: hypothetical protein VEZ47_04120 [Gemmatirosa sp.]|nr:hypothetical protein [Gemmatirosa sp.]